MGVPVPKRPSFQSSQPILKSTYINIITFTKSYASIDLQQILYSLAFGTGKGHGGTAAP